MSDDMLKKGDSSLMTNEHPDGKPQLYTWGLGKSGQLGTGNEKTEHSPQLIRLPANRDGKQSIPKQVSCGGLYTAVLTEEGDMFTAGCGKYGRLATGNEEGQSVFTQAALPEKVKQVSCGSWHGAAVTVSHGLLVWGHRKGCGDMPSNSALTSKHAIRLLTHPILLLSPPRFRVAGVSCGHNFTISWLQDGRVLSWGSGHHGVLGQGNTKDLATPLFIHMLRDEVIVQASAGYAHSAFVTKDGRVYTCGKGADGALGLGQKNLQDVFTPQLVTFPQSEVVGVIEVSCSAGEHHGHTLALTKEGRVYAWGDGYKGKLGLRSQNSQFTPALIPATNFHQERVTAVSSGGIHSAASTAEGNVYTWGCGSDGRLGHPEGHGHRYLFRSDTPKMVEGLGSTAKQPALVSCTYYHCAAIVSK